MNRKGAELLYRCPRPEHHAHGDLNPSLSVNTRKNVWACFPCAASGTAWQLAAFIARLDPSDKPAIKRWLRDRGLLKGKGPRALHAKRRQVAVYEYKNAQGNPVARKLRFMPKSFAWQRFENGTWINGLADVKPPLYRWPKIAGERFVVLTEGEKDTDAGSAIGLPCTTSGGVNSFRPDHADALRGKDVVIIRDSDDPGREYAEKVAAMLNGKAARIRVCEIPDSKDLAEALEKGVPLEVLHTLFENTPAQRTTSGAELIRRFENIFRRFVIAGTGVPLVGALYAFMTHCFENFSWISYLAFVSALESCGKSHAADIVGWASARPEILVNITPASLFRLITEEKPTVVVDEAEVLDGKDGTAIALRAVLHAGCSPDDGIIRVQPNTHTLERLLAVVPENFLCH
jgi:putative DNA primase/helicase